MRISDYCRTHSFLREESEEEQESSKGLYNLRWKLNVSADDQVFYSQHLIL